MKFFLYSKCGEGAGLAKKIQDEGNFVRMYIKEKEYRTVYEGILHQSSPAIIDDETVVIFDSSGMGREADRLKKSGKRVLGGSSFADKLECDRAFGLEFMQKHDIRVPKTHEFSASEFHKAKLFIKDEKKKFVFKPSGENLPTKLTYCGCDEEDLIRYMDYVELYFGREIESFILQEFIDGAIISSEFYISPYGFVDPINHTVEVKKFMNDDIGPSTGCSGNLVWIGEGGSPLETALRSVESDLANEGYVGPIDLNAIISEDGIFGLEWTPRFGLDAMPTWLRLLDVEVGKFISDIADGTIDEVRMKELFSGGIRITIPPYPIEPKSLKDLHNKGIPIRDLDGDSVYLYEVMKERNGDLVHSDGTGVIAVASETSEDPAETFELVEKILNEVRIPDKQYRTDLHKIIPKMYEEAREAILWQ